MKWKFIIALFAISISGILGLVYYYHLDPHLLTQLSFYEDLANPSVKIVQVKEGLRKEEIANIMADKLGWNDAEKDEFINAHLALDSQNLEGHYFPKTYLVLKDADPFEVSTTMFQEFSKETSTIKKPATAKVINQETAVKIASIIQREAGGKSDMALISGIIWNRLFKGMKLQMDATLQYAKGTEENGWWGTVSPADKNINSPYNTYQHTDLPPSAISNPGLAALVAAYNPQQTECLYYLHDKKGIIHCAKTYEEHKKNIDKYY